MARDGPIVDLGRPFADHHRRGDVSPCLLPRAGAWDAQRPSCPQACDELTAQRPTPLDVEGLVDRFVADPHRLIIGEIGP